LSAGFADANNLIPKGLTTELAESAEDR